MFTYTLLIVIYTVLRILFTKKYSKNKNIKKIVIKRGNYVSALCH